MLFVESEFVVLVKITGVAQDSIEDEVSWCNIVVHAGVDE